MVQSLLAHGGQETKNHNERLRQRFSFCKDLQTGNDRERRLGKLKGAFRELRSNRPSGIKILNKAAAI